MWVFHRENGKCESTGGSGRSSSGRRKKCMRPGRLTWRIAPVEVKGRSNKQAMEQSKLLRRNGTSLLIAF